MSSDNPHLLVTPAARLLGREWIASDSTTGVTRTRFRAPPDFANRHGTVHGGFLAAMLDSAAGMAAIGALPPDRSMVTARLDTEFLKPAPIGALEGTARIVSCDDRDVTIDAELATLDGLVVARARARMRIVRRKPTMPEE